MRALAITCLLAGGLAGPGAAQADPVGEGRVGVEAGVSTLGVFVAPDYGVGRGLRLRAPIYLGGLSTTFEDDGGNEIDADLDVVSGALMADYYVGGSGFRVSAGLSFGGYEASARAGTLTLDGRTFTGDFEARLEQERSVAPVLAAGYRGEIGAGWGISAELGLRVTDLELTTRGQEALPAAERAEFDASIARINDDLGDLGVVPFVSLGLSYAF